MSAALLRQRFVSALLANHGHMPEAEYRKLVTLARERGMSPRLRGVLLQPVAFLRTSPELRDRRIGLEDIHFDAGALALADELGRELGVAPVLPGLPNVRKSSVLRAQDREAGEAAAHPPAAAPSADESSASLQVALGQALACGKALGSPKTWQVTTAGATVIFHTEAGGQTFPAVVFQLPQWNDPAARDLLSTEAANLRSIADLNELAGWLSGLIERERAYFLAEGVTVRSPNELYGLQHLRRRAFFAALSVSLSQTAFPAGEAALVAGLLRRAEEDLIVGRRYPMQTGEHTNYWPYWNNYLAPLRKLLAQTPVGSEAFLLVKNRIEDILNHKTVFNWNRHVDEQDFEVSISGALVQRRTYGRGPGQRVSLASGSRPQRPIYEVLNLAVTGLPAEHQSLSGLPVVRYPDGSLRFDWQGPGVLPVRVGQALPSVLANYLTAQRVPPPELGVRGLVAGEEARAGIPMDWNQDGSIELSPIEIGWWGHCHNEAPLNAMGINPQRSVTLYRAERGDYLPNEGDGQGAGTSDAGEMGAAALQTYSAEELWDVAGALTSDHEGGFAIPGSLRSKTTQVEETQFVGSRNNGGHWLLIEPSGGRRRIRVDAEVKQLWHKSDASKKYDDPAQRFRRDLPTEDGAFAPNPDWVAAEASDADDITIDAQKRRLLAVVRYVTLDDQGERELRIEAVELNPEEDAAVKVAEEVQDIEAGGAGGKVVEHWYNAKTGAYSNIVFQVSPGATPRRELARSEPAPAARVLACQETVYDSVIEIHEFVTSRMGLPFVFDTSSGMAVWNYPVSEIGIEKLGQVEREEDGKRYEYTSYKLRYVTMGGPSGEARYIIKRDRCGQAERALALDPMPDFAFRQERWVCAPAASDAGGNLAINMHALKAGYLSDKGGSRIVPALWQRQATLLYAALADDLAAEDGAAYLFESVTGELYSFASRAAFTQAVQADTELRRAGR